MSTPTAYEANFAVMYEPPGPLAPDPGPENGTWPPPVAFCPVRIPAGALGPAVPRVHLIVTGDQGIFLGDVIVNAAALVNGTFIVRVPAGELPERVTDYHVETEDHDVILAAGTPAGTFPDATTREAFDNDHQSVALFGEPADAMPVLPCARVFGARQLPRRIRDLVAERAAAVGLAGLQVAA